MKFYIETLGCKVNYYESEVIKSIFLEHKYLDVNLNENPDIIIINTCTVTNQSDAKSRKVIRSARRNNPDAIIVVCGCSSEHHKEELLPLGADILIGNKDKTKILDYVLAYQKAKKTIIKYYDMMHQEFEDMVITNNYDRTRAFVKIQDGCNNYCSYCIIPYMRGTIRNKDFNTAVEEIKALTNKGFKEIVLTGIHTGSYPRLVELIREISKFPNLKRIRIGSIEITELDNEEFYHELKTNPKLCNHLHIPMQSGSSKTLKQMNRKYNITEYLEIINKIRSIRPDINLTTDLIVGFPTETNEDFKESLLTAKQIKFGKIHVFPYSKRDGTAASFMKNIVSEQAKKERTKEMIDLSNQLEHEYYEKFLNKNEDVLIEETKDNESVGYTSNYLKVRINSKLEHNQLYNVKIIKIEGLEAIGIANN